MPQISNKSQATLFRIAYGIRSGKIKKGRINAGLYSKASRIANSSMSDVELRKTAQLKNAELPAKIMVNKRGVVSKQKVNDNLYIHSFEEFINEFFISAY